HADLPAHADAPADRDSRRARHQDRRGHAQPGHLPHARRAGGSAAGGERPRVREEVEGYGAADRVGGQELLRCAEEKTEMGRVLRTSAFCLLLSAFGCTMPHSDGIIYTARTIAIGAAQTPSHDAGVLVSDGKIV